MDQMNKYIRYYNIQCYSNFTAVGTQASNWHQIWSLSWHNISRPDFDIPLVSNCKLWYIIWTPTHEVNMSRMCVENDHWKNIWWNKFCWKKNVVEYFCQCVTSIGCQQRSWIWCWQLMSQKCHFWAMVHCQLMPTVDIILMSIQYILLTGLSRNVIIAQWHDNYCGYLFAIFYMCSQNCIYFWFKLFTHVIIKRLY